MSRLALQFDRRCKVLLAVVACLALVLVVCGPDDSMMDTERLEELGKRLGAPWPIPPDCPNAIDGYNEHEELERAFAEAGGWRIELGEKELVRDRVAGWRDDYAEWLDQAEERATQYPDLLQQQSVDSELADDCKYQADTLVHRGQVVLEHVDALLN